MRPLKQWRAGLVFAAALMALSAPVAHAQDAFGGKPKADPNKELMDRLGRVEQQLTDVAAKQAAAAQNPTAAPGPGGLNLPAPPGAPPDPPVADDELKLDYEVKGELNGKVLVKKGTRLVQMERGEFDRFAAQAKARARTAAAAAVAPVLGLDGTMTPPNAVAMAPGTPPTPPAAAPTVTETTKRNGKVVDQAMNAAVAKPSRPFEGNSGHDPADAKNAAAPAPAKK